jgi:hypothetical protein
MAGGYDGHHRRNQRTAGPSTARHMSVTEGSPPMLVATARTIEIDGSDAVPT